MKSLAWHLLVIVLALSAVGCASQLQMAAVESKAEPPSNVSVLYTVRDKQGETLLELTEKNFQVFEGEREIPAGEWKLYHPDLSDEQLTIVLLDLGGRIKDEALQAIIGALTVFVERVPGGQLAVYTFDGSADPVLLVPLSATKEEAHTTLANLAQVEQKDESTDLYSNVIATTKTLASAMESEKVRLGTLVLISRGPDRAARMQQSEFLDRLDDAPINISRFAVGLGPDAKLAPLNEIATERVAFADSPTEMGNVMLALVEQMRKRATSYYLVSYCSPSRAGEHDLRIQVARKVVGEDGKDTEEQGALTYRFSASGFGGGCTPESQAPALRETDEEAPDPASPVPDPAAPEGVAPPPGGVASPGSPSATTQPTETTPKPTAPTPH